MHCQSGSTQYPSKDAALTFSCELRRTGVLILLKTCENMWCSRFKLSKVLTIDVTAKQTKTEFSAKIVASAYQYCTYTVKIYGTQRLKLPKILSLYATA